MRALLSKKSRKQSLPIIPNRMSEPSLMKLCSDLLIAAVSATELVPEIKYRLHATNNPDCHPSLSTNSSSPKATSAPLASTETNTTHLSAEPIVVHESIVIIEAPLPCETASVTTAYGAQSSSSPSAVVFDHHIFDNEDGWQRAEWMTHQNLRLQGSTDQDDDSRIGVLFPDVMPSYVSVVTDTGAQSCLWSLDDLPMWVYRFRHNPCKRIMVAANQ